MSFAGENNEKKTLLDSISSWKAGAAAGQAVEGVSFTVTPEILKSKSADVDSRVGQMRRHFEELQSCVDKTSGYWIGEAGDMHRQMYSDIKEEVEELLRRLYEYPKDLLAIAQNYMDVELTIESDIESLPGDIIA